MEIANIMKHITFTPVDCEPADLKINGIESIDAEWLTNRPKPVIKEGTSDVLCYPENSLRVLQLGASCCSDPEKFMDIFGERWVFLTWSYDRCEFLEAGHIF